MAVMFAGLFGWQFSESKHGGWDLSGPGTINSTIMTFTGDVIAWRTYPDKPYAEMTNFTIENHIPYGFEGRNLVAHDVNDTSRYLTAKIKKILPPKSVELEKIDSPSNTTLILDAYITIDKLPSGIDNIWGPNGKPVGRV